MYCKEKKSRRRYKTEEVRFEAERSALALPRPARNFCWQLHGVALKTVYPSPFDWN